MEMQDYKTLALAVIANGASDSDRQIKAWVKTGNFRFWCEAAGVCPVLTANAMINREGEKWKAKQAEINKARKAGEIARKACKTGKSSLAS